MHSQAQEPLSLKSPGRMSRDSGAQQVGESAPGRKISVSDQGDGLDTGHHPFSVPCLHCRAEGELIMS